MKNHKSKNIRRLRLEFLELYDEFSEFSEQCAFLCDAFAAIPAQQELLEPGTIGGINFYSHWLKTRVLELKNELRKMYEQLKEIT